MANLYGDDGRVFESDLLDREVVGLDVRWYTQYANTPDLVLVKGDDEMPYFDGALWRRLADINTTQPYRRPQSSIFVAYHPNGLVKYFAHSGREGVNEGGYGGAIFSIDLEDVGLVRLVGPWSSRAACVNMHLPAEQQIMDVLVRLPRGSLLSAACKVVAAAWLIDREGLPYYIIRGVPRLSDKRLRRYSGDRAAALAGLEFGAPCISLAPNLVRKPDGCDKCCGEHEHNQQWHRFESYEVLHTPRVLPAT